jgi:hypothetical protein
MSRKPRPPTAIVQLSKIRLQEQLRSRLELEARHNGVSLSGEIVGRLEQTFEQGRLLDADRLLADFIRAAEPLLNHDHMADHVGDLIRAAKGLVDRIAPLLAARVIAGEEGPRMREAVDKVIVAIDRIDSLNAKRYHQKHTR